MIGGVRHTAHGLVFRTHTRRPTEDEDEQVFVLVHGLGMSHRSFTRLARRLMALSTVVSFDLPGFGRFGRPGRAVPVEHMAAGIAAVLDTLGLRDAVVVGQSMGTQWAAGLADQRPDLVRALVLIGPVVDDENRTLRAQLLALTLDTFREPPWMSALVMLEYALCGVPWFLQQARAMLRYPLDDALRDINKPVLIIRGGRDPIAGRDWSRRLRDVSVRASLVTIPGGSHHAQQFAPGAVTSAIRAFSSRI